MSQCRDIQPKRNPALQSNPRGNSRSHSAFQDLALCLPGRNPQSAIINPQSNRSNPTAPSVRQFLIPTADQSLLPTPRRMNADSSPTTNHEQPATPFSPGTDNRSLTAKDANHAKRSAHAERRRRRENPTTNNHQPTTLFSPGTDNQSLTAKACPREGGGREPREKIVSRKVRRAHKGRTWQLRTGNQLRTTDNRLSTAKDANHAKRSAHAETRRRRENPTTNNHQPTTLFSPGTDN